MSLPSDIAVEIGIDDCSPVGKPLVGAIDDMSDEGITLSGTGGACSDEKSSGRRYAESAQSSWVLAVSNSVRVAWDFQGIAELKAVIDLSTFGTWGE